MAETTSLSNIIDPEVISDMISAKVEKKVSALPYAKLDKTLEGRSGSTIKVPQFTWDGEAVEVAEGGQIPYRSLGSKTAEYTIKKIAIGSKITDEAIECGLGDPVGASSTGIANSILAKLDEDTVRELMGASTISNAGAISYDAVVDGIGLFNEEDNGEKVMLLPPAIMTILRKDSNFIDKSKYGNNVMTDGEIGQIGGARIVQSRRIEGVGGFYYSPIIKLSADANDEIPALTYYLKRDTKMETARDIDHQLTKITGSQMYVVALTNDSKVVLVKTHGAEIKLRSIYEDKYQYPGTDVALEREDLNGSKITGGISGNAGTYTVKFKGEAKKLSGTAASTLGFSGSPTHYILCSVEIPGQAVSRTAPAATWGGNSVPATEMRRIGTAWYIDIVLAVKQGEKSIVLASGQTNLPTIVCEGITTTFTPDFSDVLLEA